MARYTPLWLQPGSYAASVDRRLVGVLWPTAASSGGAATVNAGTMNVSIAAGSAAVPTQNNTGSTLCPWDAPEVVAIGAAPGSGSNRIDVITVHPRGNDLDGGSNNDFILDVVVGTVAATPVAPAVPAGQIGLWQVYVTGGAAALVQGNLTDVRPGGLSAGGSVNRYQVKAHRVAAFTFPATANQVANLIYDTKDFDPANAYNATTGIYTCPATGLYLIRASWSIAGVAASTLNVISLKNGTNNAIQITPPLAGTGALMAQISTLDQCNAGDTITFAGQTATVSATSRLTVTETHMAIACLGPP